MGLMTALVAGGLGLAGSAMSASAAKKAGKAQADAADKAAQVQRDAAVQSRIDAYPWALAGAQALYAYMGELGIPMPKTPILPDLNRGPFAPEPQQPNAAAPVQQPQNALAPQTSPAMRGGSRMAMEMAQENALNRPAQPAPQPQAAPAAPSPMIPSPQDMEMTPALGFRETPGYQFQVQEGEKGVVNNLAALGMRDSGAALKALTRFRTGLANQEYGNYLNRLAGAAGMGQSQVNTTNALTQNAAGNIGRAYQDAGAARASGYVGAANAWSNGFNQIGNALGQMSYGGFGSRGFSGGLY